MSIKFLDTLSTDIQKGLEIATPLITALSTLPLPLSPVLGEVALLLQALEKLNTSPSAVTSALIQNVSAVTAIKQTALTITTTTTTQPATQLMQPQPQLTPSVLNLPTNL